MVKIYEYKACSTCRKAIKYLEAKGVPFECLPIVETPPSRGELERMLGHVGGDIKKLFNTSGELYRELGLAAKLGTLERSAALDLLAAHGKLVKRPFVLGEGFGLVGFNEEKWDAQFP
jgi:Spx/MgsR family transcriptional regulator